MRRADKSQVPVNLPREDGKKLRKNFSYEFKGRDYEFKGFLTFEALMAI